MLRAILFDWGNTLVRSELDPALLVEGHRLGLEAIGGTAAEQREAFTERYATVVLEPLLEPLEEEIDYAALVADALADVGLPADARSVERFVAAEHVNWRRAHPIEAATVSMLDGVRERGLRVGLVSNLFDPPELLRQTFAELGVLERLDAIAVSAEVGVRKPHARLFDHALALLGVEAAEAAHVGDRTREDVGGAAALGLRTIQARWYSVDSAVSPSPDATAESPAEVLAIVDAWLAQESSPDVSDPSL